jgi:hypothetical protein
MQLDPDILDRATPEQLAEIDRLIAEDIAAHPWRPLPGPQTDAFNSKADVIGYGGAAGGGKTDLAVGMATCGGHYRVQIFRKEGPELTGIIDRLTELLGSRDGYNGQDKIWRLAKRGLQIELCSMPNPGDEKKYQGRPKDLLVIDEAANFIEAPVRFVKGWVRTTRQGVKPRTLMTFNPPTTTEGGWVVDYFGPWLDETHPLYPTAPAALRWVYVDPATGKDIWILDDDARRFVLIDGQRQYAFNPKAYKPEEIITPESRTFIFAKITDNPFLVSTGYMAQLQSLPEPLRSQMLLGDFKAGRGDHARQLIPTEWVRLAQERWKNLSPRGEMLSVGVDVARGGKDKTVIATRHKAGDSLMWYAPLLEYAGKDTPNGNEVAAYTIAAMRDQAPIHIDVIGVGSSPYDILQTANMPVYGVNVAEAATDTDKTGLLRFSNLRTQLWWKLREALDPEANTGIALPPDRDLLAELCAPRWDMVGRTISMWSRDKIIDEVGRSPDRATAIVLANIDTPKIHMLGRSADHAHRRDQVTDYNPYA